MKRLLILAGLLAAWWIEHYLEAHYGNADGDMIDAEYWRYGEIYNDNTYGDGYNTG